MDNLENDIRLSQGVLIGQNETTKRYGYALSWFPDLQNLLKELKEESGLDYLKFEEPCLTIVVQKNPNQIEKDKLFSYNISSTKLNQLIIGEKF